MKSARSGNDMQWIITASSWMIPILICIILIYGTIKKVPTYETFVEGGKEGVKLAFSIIPFLVGMLAAIAVCRASGAFDFFVRLIEPILKVVNVPGEIVPLALVRPLSGTAALGVTSDLTSRYGPDSFIGRLAAVMQGSTDTTFYILTVYFGAVGIKKMKYAIKVGLLADVVNLIFAVTIVSLVFGR
jgi:spore maturation protein B